MTYGALEVLRIWRSRRPLMALAALSFFVVLMLIGFYTYAQTETGGQVEFRYTFENRSYFNGLTFALYAFYFGFLLVLPIFAATEGGAQIAGDSSSGVLWLLLSRPVTRVRVFFTKLGLAAAVAAGLVGAFLALVLLIGLVAVGWGDLDLYPGVLQMADRHQHLQLGQALRAFALAWPAASLALFVPLALGFWVATWLRSAVNAVATAVALYLVMYVIAEIHFFETLRPWLFTSYMSYWRGLFREEIDWAGVLRDGARLAGFAALFCALAFRRFRLREEHGS